MFFQKEILNRLNAYVSTGEDIAVDLRQNNGAIPKYEDFWKIVAEYIEDKTAVDDRRHASSTGDGDVVVNMALALSYADLYRTCCEIAKLKEKEIKIPSYEWFLLQFWPTTRSKSKILKYTGRFKIKRMIQSRVMRKENCDLHYTNAIYSFLKDRAQSYADSCSLVSADAKCKVTLGEPGYPIAAVTRGKRVIVGSGETLQVGDHDFSKISLIPDAILIQDIPRPNVTHTGEDEDVLEGSETKSWYRGQVYYSVKSMVGEGSTAWRCMVELGKVLEAHHVNIPSRVYCYTDGGGDRRMTFLQVQLAVIALFFVHHLDEVIVARTAAGCSFRNPVERCHCVANLGLQGIGLMREKMEPEMEKIMANCNSNATIRGKCDENAKFNEAINESIKPAKELMENVFRSLALKEKKFRIYSPASDEEIETYRKTIIDQFGCFPSCSDEPPIVKDFYDKHCVKRTYFFQVKKCDDATCSFHLPLKEGVEVDNFPDPIPYDDNGIERYKKGIDSQEKFLPSNLVDVTKRPHNVPFSPTAQTAKAASMVIRCVECKKARVIHSKKKLTQSQVLQLKRALNGLQYVCGSSFNEFDSEKESILNNVFVRENICCTTNIELTYYSADIFPRICIHCGTKQNLVPKCIENYPRCRDKECNKKGDVLRRKRKSITGNDLSSKKKK